MSKPALRNILSLIAFWTLLLLLISGVVLYIVPKGRIANRIDWTLLGMDKHEWGNLHNGIGWLFVVSGFLHLLYNWRRFFSYLKNRAGKVRILTVDFIVATLLTLWVAVGSVADWPPFGLVNQWMEEFRQGERGWSVENGRDFHLFQTARDQQSPEERQTQPGSDHPRGGGWKGGRGDH